MGGEVVILSLAAVILGVAALYLARRRTHREVAKIHSATAEADRWKARVAELEAQRLSWRQLAEQRVKEEVSERRVELERALSDLEWQRLRLRGLAHDIRNPLVAVQFVADEVVAITGDETIRERMADQVQAIERCSRLITEMVAVVTGQADVGMVERTPCHVESFAAFARDRVRELSGRDSASIVMSARTPSEVSTDARRLERVLDNLLSNSFRHAGGRDVAVQFEGSPDELVIRVSDSGPGLPPELIAGLARTNGPRLTGSGVGLSVVLGLLDDLGGSLEVHSDTSVGSAFWVRIPTRTQELAPSTEREPVSRVHERVSVDEPRRSQMS